MNDAVPTGQETRQLPKDAVALMLWRVASEYGPEPLTIVVTRNSWEAFKQVVINDGQKIDPDKVYHLESPANPNGRRTEFFLSRVVAFAASFHSGIVPVKG